MNYKSLLPSTLAAAALATLASAGSTHAQTFTEVGNAGQTPGTVQASGLTQSATIGQAVTINGNISGLNDADLYSFNITNATRIAFSTVNATTLNSGSFPGAAGGLDTQLFLFTSAGVPIYANNDASGTSLQSFLPGGTSFTAALSPGLYYLGISLSDTNPVNTANQLVFATGATSTDVTGPSSGLNPASFSDFNGLNTLADSGNYQINIQTVPEPSTYALALFGVAAGAVVLRRRNRVNGAVAL